MSGQDTLSAGGVVLITPSDSADVDVGPEGLRGISFATEGDIKVTDIYENDVVIPSGALAAGIMHPLRVKRIWATDTDATNIVGYYQ